MPDIDTCPICVASPLEGSTTFNNIAWLQCDICNQWFHASCLKIPKIEVNNLHSYHCEGCSKSHGPSIPKRKLKRSKVQIDYVALNDGDVFAVDKSLHPHVDKFLSFEVNANEIDDKINPYIDFRKDITADYALDTRLTRPVLIPRADLDIVDMKLPIEGKEITIDYIANEVGDDTPLDVMDVLTQQGVNPGWNLGKWRDYYNTDELSRDRIRNVISLEISDVDSFGKSFRRPRIVRDMDLVDKVWNDKSPRPKVTKYCLMSVTGSFTDFHIDFSGTSVYYTVCSGSKTFLMYPPTEQNLDIYTSWCLQPDQNYMWFGDFTKAFKGKGCTPSGGFKVTLSPGDLFIIPSGWIHAVFTPEDSLVIGGNFLTLMDLSMHLRIYEIEKVTRVPAKFRFPMFNRVLWLTSWYYYNNKSQFLKDLGQDAHIKNEAHIKSEAHSRGEVHTKTETHAVKDEPQPDQSVQYKTLSCLVSHLQSHYESSKINKVARNTIPAGLIGKDIPGYLAKLQSWLDELSP